MRSLGNKWLKEKDDLCEGSEVEMSRSPRVGNEHGMG